MSESEANGGCDGSEATEAGAAGGCACCHGHTHDESHSSVALWCVCIAGALTTAGLIVSWSGVGGPWTSRACHLAAVLTAGWMLLPGAWNALRRLSPDMNLLMVVAVGGALVLGDWAEAAAVVFLFSLSELLESYATRRSHRALESLLALAPDTALVETDGRFIERDVSDIAIGERVRVRSGEQIPLDGEVVAGASAVDQSPITGESIPVEKMPGAAVFAGTVNGAGSLDILVTKRAGDSTLARIVALVEDAQEAKAPVQRFVDRFARYYTPAVFAAAIIVAVAPPLLAGGEWADWIYRALVLLVIACPCALVISTPVAVVTALTALARRGVLVKAGAHLETLGRLRALAVDKTGTITEGRPRLLAIHQTGATDASMVLQVASAIEAHSQHPLAAAILDAAEDRGVTPAQGTLYRAHAGLGAEGVLEGHRYFVGNHRLTHELGVCSTALEEKLAGIEASGHSVVVVGHAPHDACVGETLGVLAVGDTLRPGVADVVRDLHAAGVRPIVMLSGDNQRTVSAVARAAGIDDARGDLLPEDKAAAVRRLVEEHGIVGMVGDGVNDAPALATASIGIAMGAAGSDTAIETADVALMNDDLGKVIEAIQVGRRTLGIIRANITFALATKAVFLALAVTGYTSLWLAIFADTGTTLLVIANSLRLLRTPATRAAAVTRAPAPSAS